MDEVEDFSAERFWDKGAWATYAYITQIGAAFASNVNIFPLQAGDGCVVFCSLWVIFLGCCYFIVVNSEVYRVYFHPLIVRQLQDSYSLVYI